MGIKKTGAQKSKAKKSRRPDHNRIRVLCSLCRKPANAYHTGQEYTYYKCKGFNGEKGCGHTFMVSRNGN